MPLSVHDAKAIELVLSPDRLRTYQRAIGVHTTEQAITLYVWNAQISAALMLPQQVCEVVMRNAVSDALSAVYGRSWPWAYGFERSLPNPASGFSLRSELCAARTKASAGRVGTVITELKFAFWIRLFAQRFESRVWEPHIRRLFPGLPQSMSVRQGRENIYLDLERVRDVRNRIAHHEPIFARNLLDDYQRMHRLVAWRCPQTAGWLASIESVRQLMDARP